MIKNIINSFIVLSMGMGTIAYAESGFTPFADIGGYSQYLARGVPQGTGSEFSLQGDIGLEHDSGLSASVWFATGVGSDKEYDFILDYSAEAGEFDYSVGYYSISYVDSSADNGGELYGSLSYKPLTAAIYSAKDYNYYELTGEHSIADILDATLIVGYEDAMKKSDISIGLSREFEIQSFTLTPSLVAGKLEGGNTEFMAGFNASF